MKTLKFIVLDTDNKSMRLYDNELQEIKLKEGCDYDIKNGKLYMYKEVSPIKCYSRVIANVADSVHAVTFDLGEGVNIFHNGINTLLGFEYSRIIRRVKTIMIDIIAGKNKDYDVWYCDNGEPYLYCSRSNGCEYIYVDDNLNIVKS